MASKNEMMYVKEQVLFVDIKLHNKVIFMIIYDVLQHYYKNQLEGSLEHVHSDKPLKNRINMF